MLNIQISTDTRYPVDRKLIRKSVEDTLKKHMMTNADVEVSVTVVGRRKMKDITSKYLGDGKMHEVLSFPLEEISQTTAGGHGFINPPDGVLRLGDVVLCYPEVILAAARDNAMVGDEIYSLCGHGVDHLLGVHHE